MEVEEQSFLFEVPLVDEALLSTKKHKKTKIIIFSIIGGIVILGVISFLLYYFLFSKKKEEEKEKSAFKLLFEDNEVIKSLVNKAQVKVIQLKNGLNVTLISDKQLAKSQAGIVVHSGFCNEGDVEGLAHFTEHMLFLGSKEFPSPSEFDDYLAVYKGTSNAMTDIAVTLYYYDILQEGYHQSLKMFSSILKEPIFSEKYIDKEINAVDSEFDGLLNRDDQREAEILARLYGGHFSVGNNKSLKKIETTVLMQKMKAYHTKYYNARNMHLILYSNETIETLLNYSVTLFQDIRQGDTLPQETQSDDYVNKMSKIIWLETIMPIYFLEFVFTLPYHDITNSPFKFIEYLLDDRSEKAFQTVMIKKNYIDRMINLVVREDKDHFELSIALAVKIEAFSKLKEISEALFSYLNMLKTEKIEEKIYEEFRSSIAQQARFAPLDPDISILLLNANKIRKELKYVLDISPWVNGKFNETLVKSYLDYLSMNNCLIVVGSNDLSTLQSNSIKDYSMSPESFFTNYSKDEYYDTKYNVHEIKKEVIERLNNIKDYQEYGMKPSNEYISKEKNLIECKESKEICQEEKKSNAIQVVSEKNLALYYKTDRSFLLPKTNGRFRFLYPGIRTLDPKTYTMTKLFFYYLQQKIKTRLNDAFVTGNTFFWNEDENGFTLDLTSFSDIFVKVVTNTMTLMFKHEITQLELKGLIEELKLKQDNVLTRDSNEVCEFTLLKILKINNREEYGEIDTQIDKLMEIFTNYSKDFIMEVLFFGNIDKETSTNIYNKALKGKLNPSSVTIQKEFGVDSTDGVIAYISQHFTFNGSYVYRIRSTSPYEDNHCILNLYYIGHYQKDYHEFVAANLIYVSWGRLFYTRLRTELQLGYMVESSLLNQDYKFYLKFSIQGNIETPQRMNELIDEVIKEGELQINTASEETFKQWKEMVKVKEQLSFATKSEYLFKMIMNRISFEDKDIDSILSKITKESLIQKYREIFIHKVRKLSVQVYNNNSTISIPMENESYYLNNSITSIVSNSLNILSK